MSTKEKETKEGPSMTARDFELLAKALTCLKSELVVSSSLQIALLQANYLQVDYVKFAEKGPFKNPNSAKASWHGVKKKLDKLGGGAIAGQ